MDCSEFVYQAYHKAEYVMFPALISHAIARMLKSVETPQMGEIVYWPIGHVAIVKDPATGVMLHAASSKGGLREDSYKVGWVGEPAQAAVPEQPGRMSGSRSRAQDCGAAVEYGMRPCPRGRQGLRQVERTGGSFMVRTQTERWLGVETPLGEARARVPAEAFPRS